MNNTLFDRVFGNSKDVSDTTEILENKIAEANRDYDGMNFTIRQKSKVGEYLQTGRLFYIADLNKKKIYSSNDLRIGDINEKLESENVFMFIVE